MMIPLLTPPEAARMIVQVRERLRVAAFNPDQPRDEQGQWTAGGGSGPGDSFRQESNKAWVKANQKRYDSDPQFKAAVDAATLLTQGSTNQIHAISAMAAGHESIVPAHFRESKDLDEMMLDSVASPIAAYKNYFAGQDVENASHATLREAGHAINEAVATAPPLDVSFYRGIAVQPSVMNPDYMKEVSVPGSSPKFTLPNPAHEALVNLKAGDTFDVHGVSSFTTDKFLAEQFARGEARGQPGYQAARRGSKDDYYTHVTFEVEPGARGLSVAALSPWKQKEIISRGRFKVVAVTKNKRDKVEDLHVKLKQTHAR